MGKCTSVHEALLGKFRGHRSPVREVESKAGIEQARRNHKVFQDGVTHAADAPAGKVAEALGRLLYLAHLSVILLWLLDRSPRQRATSAFVALLEKAFSSFSLALRFPPVRSLICAADTVFQDAIFGGARDGLGNL